MKNILSKLHQLIDRDVARLFKDAKKESIQRGQHVARLEAELVAARVRALEASEEARRHAEAAANAAQRAHQELLLEAKSAAERAEYHKANLPTNS